MNFSSPLKCLLIMVAVQTSTAFAKASEQTSYANEQAIVFETMDGKTTDAFSGEIQVPENRTNKNSRLIPVKYVRFPATGKNKGSPIVYLSGGPGGSGIMTAKYARFPLFMALREFGDVIALDQRGTGASAIVPECTSSQSLPLNKVLSEQQVTNIYQLATKECLVTWAEQGADVYGYTTEQNAHDLNDLRMHLGADKITLWGISYGSHLALAAMKQMAKHIDKVVIASAEGLDQTIKLPARTDAYLARLQQAINTQPETAKYYPDIIGLMHKVHSNLTQAPITLQTKGKNGEMVDFLLQKELLQGIASSMVADPHRGVPYLLALYQTLAMGDHSVINEIIKRGFINDDNIKFSIMSFAMDTASGISQQRLQLFEQQAKTSVLGKALNFPTPHLLNSVDGLDLGDDFRQKPNSNIPTLLLTGTLDGRTYVEAQTEATSGLSNLTQVMVVNAGHNLFMSSEKVTATIKKFLKDEKISERKIKVELASLLLAMPSANAK